MAFLLLVLLLLSCCSLGSASLLEDFHHRRSSSSSSDISGAVQAELLERGFPVGLIPGIILSYTLREDDGAFEVALQTPCHFTIPGARTYPISYDAKVSGTISQHYIYDLRGVSVKALHKWWPITSIRALDGGNGASPGASQKQISFEIDGALSVSFPASNFDEIPECDGSSSSSFWIGVRR